MKPKLDQGPDYERGFIDGMQHQMQSSVDKAVNAKAPWVGLTEEEFLECCHLAENGNYLVAFQRIGAKLMEKNT